MLIVHNSSLVTVASSIRLYTTCIGSLTSLNIKGLDRYQKKLKANFKEAN